MKKVSSIKHQVSKAGLHATDYTLHATKTGLPRINALATQTRSIWEQESSVRGFTLIEVLIAAALMVMLAAGFVGLQYILSQNQVAAWRDFQSIESANGGISSMAKEIRNAEPSELGSYPLVTANDQSLIFYSDYDFDGVVERVRYTLAGTTLSKGILEPTGNPITYNVSSESVKAVSEIVRNGAQPVFYYYDANWPEDTVSNPLPLADRIADTRQIKIVLSTNPKAGNPDNNYRLESDVKIRRFNQQP